MGAMSGPVICTLEAAPTGLEPDLSLDSQSQAEEIVTVSWAPDFQEGIKYNPFIKSEMMYDLWYTKDA